LLALLFRPVRLGTLFGIPILLVPAVLVLVALALLPTVGDGRGLGTPLLLIAVLAASLMAHELAHALVARRLGLHVLDITIWPLGGMARLKGMSERPQVEAPVAAAGPLANLALAAISAPFPGEWAAAITWINMVLGAGNLLPAFPLDGGRLLRAWLARASPMVDATWAAVKVDRWLALILTILAIGNGFPLLGIVLGVYVWWSGQAEFLQVFLRGGRPPSLALGEVFRRAWRRTTAGAAGFPWTPGGDDAEPVDENEPEADLERFRGTLDEYFRDRRR
jgi:Zn-dependent protease